MKTLPDSSELLLRISEGDEKAYEIFFDFYYGRLYPFVLKFTKSAADAEEVLQETFVRIWLNRDKLPELENINGWIYRVASRECLTFLRKSQLDRSQFSKLSEETEDSTARVNTPVDLVYFQEVNALILQAIDRMPNQRKRIFRLSRDEGMKPAEIAVELNLSVSTVKNVLTTALREIREHLSNEGFDFALVMFVVIKYLQNFPFPDSTFCS
ncbi:RNA polymerase sigma-70 factor [Dyadobacter sp. CY323]|uniref:RNA polymerase sigma-70 factor n=1 Tax=Dyadobacter sp. CY323 TaxID=2907302 RepID=UPI001F2373A6|nr:RNA polymerase sigma-70 factor [Dyadobacter sp. CY323]MCE6989841.1 RNA polymerase sigma-70 factor [Dyadobacter sp. CY323]